MNLDDVLIQWRTWQLAQGLSPRTIGERALVISYLVRYTGADPLKVSASDIVAFVARTDISASTKATYHASIRAYCKWLVTVGLRKKDASARTPRPKRPKGSPRPVHDFQLERLLNQVNRRRTRAMILLAALAGLRVHEIAKIRGEDIDLEAGTLCVLGKGNKMSVIPLHPRLAEEALAWPKTGFWFPNYATNRHGESGEAHIRSHAVSKAIRQTMARAGVEGKAHQLRHWYGTALLSKGVDLRVVQTLMRHESPATTALYTKVDHVQQRKGIDLLRIPDSQEAA